MMVVRHDMSAGVPIHVDRGTVAGDVPARLANVQAFVDPALERALELSADASPRLLAAMRYALLAPGKRLRPALVLWAASAACSTRGVAAWQTAVGAAVAVEMIHAYSLVHDDLPAMDDDDERRGRPTVHVVYGDATAILVGDGLLTAAFERVADSSALVKELARAAGPAGMVGGQYIDIKAQIRSLDELVHLHELKTGALIRAACRMGGFCGGADEDQLVALTRYGAAVGLAFQVADDVLDADQDAGEGGPPSYVRLLGLEATRAEAHRLAVDAITAAQELPNPHVLVALARFTVERTV